MVGCSTYRLHRHSYKEEIINRRYLKDTVSKNKFNVHTHSSMYIIH